MLGCFDFEMMLQKDLSVIKVDLKSQIGVVVMASG